MKSLSKTFKTAFMFIALLFAGTLFAISPVSHSIVFAETGINIENQDGANVLKVTHTPQSVVDLSADGEVRIPFLNTADIDSGAITNYTIRLTESGHIYDYNVVVGVNDTTLVGDAYNYGEGVNAEDVESSTQSFFEVIDVDGTKYLTINSQATATYNIVYIYKNGSKVYYSNTYKMEVIGQDYELDFSIMNMSDEETPTIVGDSNEDMLFPTQQKTGTSLTIQPVYSHPIYEDDYEITSEDYEDWKVVAPVFTFNGVRYEVDEKYSANGQEYTLFTQNQDGTYTINFAIAGKYAVAYTDSEANNTPTSTKTITITDDFVAPTSENITVTSPTLPSSTELGDEDVTLPSLTLAYSGTNFTDNNVSYNIDKIVIAKDITQGGNISIELGKNELTFDFTTEYFTEKLSRAVTYDDLAGSYNVTYYITDVYGNEIVRTYQWKNITISTRPSIYLAYDYEAFTGEDTDKTYSATLDSIDTSVTTEIKNEYGYSELIFPAVYAYDKISNYDDLLVVRYIQNADTGERFYLDNVRVNTSTYEYEAITDDNSTYNYNYACNDTGWSFDANDLDTYYERLSQSVSLKMWEGDEIDNSLLDDNYYLYYRVYCKNTTPGTTSSSHRNNYVTDDGSSSSTAVYEFEILGTPTSTDESVDLAVSINNTIANGQQVKQGDELEVGVTATDGTDTRLNTALFYYTGEKAVDAQDFITAFNGIDKTGLGEHSYLKSSEFISAVESAGYTNFGLVDSDSLTSYTLNIDQTFIDSISSETSFKLIAVTLNDYGQIAVSGTKQINISNTTETDLPTVNSVEYNSSNSGDGTLFDQTWWTAEDATKTVGQNVEVLLPNITYSDSVDDVLNLSVRYYVVPNSKTDSSINDENFVSAFKSPTNFKTSGNTIYGGTIKTSTVGTYYVIYTATDDAGNSTITHFNFTVTSSSDPTLTVTLTGIDHSGSGTRYSCDAGSVIGFESSVVDPSNENSDVTESSDIDIDIQSDGLYWEADGARPNSFRFYDYGEYTVIVTASYNGHTVSKTYTITVEMPTLAWVDEDKFTYPDYASPNDTVQLNALKASQGEYVTDVKVTYTDPNGRTYEAEWDASLQKYIMNTNEKGQYTVTYTATSNAPSDNQLTMTFTIQVGDNQPPVINIGNEGVLAQDITYTNSDIQFVVRVNRSRQLMTIDALRDGETIYTWTSYASTDNLDNVNFKIVENDNENGQYDSDYSWTDLEIDITGATLDSTETETIDGVTYTVYTYTVSSTGAYSFSFSITDGADNNETRTIEFNVVTESEPTGMPDNVVGIVLIVISIVILLGVIMFFLFTGRKGGGNKTKSVKKVEDKSNSKKTDSSNDDNNNYAVEGEVE